jgi:hypothetical protein
VGVTKGEDIFLLYSHLKESVARETSNDTLRCVHWLLQQMQTKIILYNLKVTFLANVPGFCRTFEGNYKARRATFDPGAVSAISQPLV